MGRLLTTFGSKRRKQYTVPITTTARDGYAQKWGAAYPPANNSANTTDTYVIVVKGFGFGAAVYADGPGLLGFDVGAVVPAGEPIVLTDLEIWPETINAENSPRLQAEYYNWGAGIDFADYSTTIGTSAFSGVDFSAWGTAQYRAIPLSNPGANLQRSGLTMLRIGLDLTMSAGLVQNRLRFYSIDALAGARKPRLIVTTEVDA